MIHLIVYLSIETSSDTWFIFLLDTVSKCSILILSVFRDSAFRRSIVSSSSSNLRKFAYEMKRGIITKPHKNLICESNVQIYHDLLIDTLSLDGS